MEDGEKRKSVKRRCENGILTLTSTIYLVSSSHFTSPRIASINFPRLMDDDSANPERLLSVFSWNPWPHPQRCIDFHLRYPSKCLRPNRCFIISTHPQVGILLLLHLGLPHSLWEMKLFVPRMNDMISIGWERMGSRRMVRRKVIVIVHLMKDCYFSGWNVWKCFTSLATFCSLGTVGDFSSSSCLFRDLYCSFKTSSWLPVVCVWPPREGA